MACLCRSVVSHYLFIIYYNIRSVFCQAFHVCYLLNFIYFFILFSINIFQIGRRIPAFLYSLFIILRIPRLLCGFPVTFYSLYHIKNSAIGRETPDHISLFIYINVFPIGANKLFFTLFIYINVFPNGVRIPRENLFFTLFIYINVFPNGVRIPRYILFYLFIYTKDFQFPRYYYLFIHINISAIALFLLSLYLY